MSFSNITDQQFRNYNYLPHNFLAEKMILSCLLSNPKSINLTIQNIGVNAFYFKNHQEIYKSILYMQKNNLTIDLISLTTFLQENGLLNKIGGIRILIELTLERPNIQYLEEYLKLIKDKFLRRCLIKLGYEIINSGYITNTSLETILNNFEQKLVNITNVTRGKQLSTGAELLNQIFLELKENSLAPSLSGIPSGFYDLDCLTQGFQPSDLIIIAGRPSLGKTALSLNISLNVLKELKLPVIFFSLEMSKMQIMYRLLSIETNIDQFRLKSGKLHQQDWLTLNKIIKILSKLPFFIDDKSNLSIQTMRSKLKTIAFEQTKLGLVVIDYLQLMQNTGSRIENRVQELSQITRSLKMIAREFNVPIIALSQLSRNIENRTNKIPLLSDLRESGSIEQDADLVLMLHNQLSLSKSQRSSNRELILAKQRNGPTGKITLKFDKQRITFSNITDY